ncbi:MAG: cupin domain-containing protein, partial [Deltaproteobacteria bacterium]|nr:cupin domain-containing protein [Deltaproteobacteria bacterium]
MAYEEKDIAMTRKVEANYYQERLKAAQDKQGRERKLKKIVTPEEMPWELCPQGIVKHLVNDKMGTRVNTVDICMQMIPGGSRSGKHRHMAEEYMFILEGKGYSLHWDVEMELGDRYYWKAQDTPSRWEWEPGDSVYIPPNTIHQHFNSDPT